MGGLKTALDAMTIMWVAGMIFLSVMWFIIGIIVGRITGKKGGSK